MSVTATHEDKIHSLCTLLEQEGVSSKVIEDFTRSLRESDLLDLHKDKPVGGTSLKRVSNPSTANQPPNAPQSLSPIRHQLHYSSSPSSSTGASPNISRISLASIDRRNCFDSVQSAIDYEWVASRTVERKALVQKLLRSPRPPTSDEKRRAAKGCDSNFDAFSEHDPKVRGLKQLYIPPPSPKVSRRIDSSDAILSASFEQSFESGVLSVSSSNMQARVGRGFGARPVHRSIPFLLESDRFDSFPDQEPPASTATTK